MILSARIDNKSFGSEILFEGLEFTVQPKEKVGIIGRNGCGKSTLFRLITGEDTDIDGEIQLRRGAVLAFSRQEHAEYSESTVMEYILGDLPQYAKLKHIIDTYPEKMQSRSHMQSAYADAVEHFSSLGYFEIEDRIREDLSAYQIDDQKSSGLLGELSGGQKRLVELVKIQASKADIVLIDEPTNHMDSVAKDTFIRWMNQTPEAMCIITHDRDVLAEVDRIIEIRDGLALSYPGNYEAYLRVNTVKIVSELHDFSVVQRRIAHLKDDVIRFKRFKEKARHPGTIARFKSLQQKAEKELVELSAREKPTFWIDKASTEQLNDKVAASYQAHKAKTIRLKTNEHDDAGSMRTLVDIHDLSLGYNAPLFSGLSFRLSVGSHIRIAGRNGAGKTTLIRTMLETLDNSPLTAQSFGGYIECEKALKVGVYRQEVVYPDGLILYDAIEAALMAADALHGESAIRAALGNYLFDPISDAMKEVRVLSGGQKARLQLIEMLAGDPQLLVLDEPTNHLDLPSIEELEAALQSFKGAILYISHDSYFAKNIDGELVDIDKYKK